jgi:hypothetical protein
VQGNSPTVWDNEMGKQTRLCARRCSKMPLKTEHPVSDKQTGVQEESN